MKQPDIRDINSRTISLDRESVQTDSRTIELALSSETPVMRWFGMETLGHKKGEVDLSRLSSGAPLLVGHDTADQVGVVENARLDSDGIVRCEVRFGRSARAEEIYQDVLDGIRSKVSVGYQIQRYETTKGQKGEPDQVRATLWQPMEASIVAVPADDSVGVGRALESDEAPQLPVVVPVTTTEVRMDTITVAAPAANPLAERQEALQIQSLGESLGVGNQVREILGTTSDLNEARQKAIALIGERAAQPIPTPVELSKKEMKEYSYARAILSSALRQEGNNSARGFEDEISDDIARNLPQSYKAKGGIFVPLQVRAGLDSGATNAGAELKYTEFGGELIELLRNLSAVISSGARVMTGLNGPVSFPRQTGAATGYWLAENGAADATASALALSTCTLTPKTLQATTSFSRQLLQQSVLAVESLIRTDLAAVHALAIDKAAIHGTGSSNQPTGIYRTSGVSTKAMAGVPTFGKIQDMITAVATSNALMKNLGFMTTPGMAGLLAQTLRASAAGSDMIWQGGYENGTMNSYKAVATNQVATAMNVLVDTGGSGHGILFGNWDDVLIGLWGALEIITDPYALKKQGMIEVTSFQMADIQIRHAASFCVATGATLT